MIGLELDKGEPMDEEMIRSAEADEAAAGWIPVAERMSERNKKRVAVHEEPVIKNRYVHTDRKL